MKKPITAIDCFSGAGGLSTGLERAGIMVLGAVEQDLPSFLTYTTNHPDTLSIRADIRQLKTSHFKDALYARYGCQEIDLVAGGPPCESFSIAGDRKEGDDRDSLFKSMLDIAHAFKSKMIIFENVLGMFSKKVGKNTAVNYVFNEMEEYGYKVKSKRRHEIVLNSSKFGVPQVRKRLFIVGAREDRLVDMFSYPEPTMNDSAEVSVAEAFTGLPSLKPKEAKHKYSVPWDDVLRMVEDQVITQEGFQFLNFVWSANRPKLSWHQAPGHIKRMIERFRLIRPGESQKTAAERLIDEGKIGLRESYFPKSLYGARNRRLQDNKPSFTVTSHCLDEIVHPRENRGLSPREVARLQSFPDDYEFCGEHTLFHGKPEQDVYEQIGDAVPPLLAYKVGEEIVASFRNQKQSGRKKISVN